MPWWCVAHKTLPPTPKVTTFTQTGSETVAYRIYQFIIFIHGCISHRKVNDTIALDEQKISAYTYPILACVLGAQKNRLIETVLLSTHNICFD